VVVVVVVYDDDDYYYDYDGDISRKQVTEIGKS
jgi:hypothetical protein